MSLDDVIASVLNVQWEYLIPTKLSITHLIINYLIIDLGCFS